MPPQEHLNSIAIKTNPTTPRVTFNPVSLLNLALIASAAVLVFYYVISANGVAAANYSVSSLRTEVASATVAQTDLTLEAQALEDSDVLTVFALAHGMVPANNVSY